MLIRVRKIGAAPWTSLKDGFTKEWAAAERMQPARQTARLNHPCCPASGANADYAIYDGEKVFEPVAHLSGEQFLLFKRLLEFLFGSGHLQCYTDEIGKLLQRGSVTAVEIPDPVGDDPKGAEWLRPSYI